MSRTRQGMRPTTGMTQRHELVSPNVIHHRGSI
jgi:hypothetical protein